MDHTTPTILVVDDEAIIRNILAKLIHTLGYSMLQAANSTQAVSMIRQHKPDLVLLDIVMPGVDSMEVLRTVRGDADLSHTAIILISAINDLETVSAYIQAGADDFLPKPFNSALLGLKIRNALERAAIARRLQSALQARDVFCQQLSHDLNNSLTGIMMSAELILMEQASSSTEQHVREIIAATEQLSATIRKQRDATSENSDNSS